MSCIQQLDFANACSGILYQIPGDVNDDLSYYAGVVKRISENDIGSIVDKSRVEFQGLDLCPIMPAEGEDAINTINTDIIELEGRLVQEVSFSSLSLETVINKYIYVLKLYQFTHRKK